MNALGREILELFDRHGEAVEARATLEARPQEASADRLRVMRETEARLRDVLLSLLRTRLP